MCCGLDQDVTELQEGRQSTFLQQRGTSVSFAGPVTKESRDSENLEPYSGIEPPLLQQSAGSHSGSASQDQQTAAVPPPQRAKFRNMVNKIRAVNNFQTKQVINALYVAL